MNWAWASFLTVKWPLPPAWWEVPAHLPLAVIPALAVFCRVKYVTDGPAWLSAKAMLTRWFGSIPIWKKSARLRSELPRRPPVEIWPVWLEWSVAWLTAKAGDMAWPLTLSATNTFQSVVVDDTEFESPA